MATTPQPFLATAPATRIIRVTSTNLFAIAARVYGDGRLWTAIAQANGLIDPWVKGTVSLVVPPAPKGVGVPSGVLGA
jgi:nucleoid-associated protein YgaU